MKTSTYNPSQIRRCVREQASIDGLHAFTTKSFTNTEDVYHPIVDVTTGQMECTCGDWRYRGQKTNTPCKHLQRAMAGLTRKGIEV